MKSFSKSLCVALSALIMLSAPGIEAAQAAAATINYKAPIVSRLAIPALRLASPSAPMWSNVSSLVGTSAAINAFPALGAAHLRPLSKTPPTGAAAPAAGAEAAAPGETDARAEIGAAPTASDALSGIAAHEAPAVRDEAPSSRMSGAMEEEWDGANPGADGDATAEAAGIEGASAAHASQKREEPPAGHPALNALRRGTAALKRGVFSANAAAGTKIDVLAKKSGFDAEETRILRNAGKFALVVSGLVFGLHALIASPFAINSVLMAAGAMATMYAKDYRQNIVKGIQFLIANPFRVHDRLIIEEIEYVVVDMTLGEVALRQISDSKDLTKFAYTQLADKVIIVKRSYQKTAVFADAFREATHSGKKIALDQNSLKPIAAGAWAVAFLLAARAPLVWNAATVLGLSFTGGIVYLGMFRKTRWLTRWVGAIGERHGWRRKTLRTARVLTVLAAAMAVGSFLGYAIPSLHAALTVKAFASAYPSLIAAAGLYLTHAVERAAARYVKQKSWPAQTSAVMRRFAQIVCYGVGLPFALGKLNWLALRDLFHLGMGLVLVFHDLISDLVHSSGKLQIGLPHFLLGPQVAGTPVAVTSLHVVFDPGNGHYVLVPHETVKSSAYKLLRKDQDEALKSFFKKFYKAL